MTDAHPDHVGPNPGPCLKDDFLKFHRANPHVYAELVREARRLRRLAPGARIGFRMLFERLRWTNFIRTSGDESGFKLNNNSAPYYSRVIQHYEHDLQGAFKTRRLHGPDLSFAELWEVGMINRRHQGA